MAKKKEPAPEAAIEKIISFKGLDKDFACRGHQFEVGKTYTVSGRIKACERGFHACENPFDVWSYYPVGEGNRFAVVEQSGDVSRHDADSKIASASITITAELTLPQFIRRAVDWIIEKAKGGEPQTGEDSSGDYARIGSSGDYARIGSSGDYARIGSSGHSAQIGSSGDYARIGSSGDCAQIDVEGENCVVASAGYNATVKGPDGLWVSLAEYVDGKCVGFATGCIGRDGLKAGVLYRASGGKLVEA